MLALALLGALVAALAATAPASAQEQEHAWVGQKSGTFASLSLYDVSFVDVSRGWVVGAGGGFLGEQRTGPSILTTSDGGRSWTRQQSGLTDGQLQGVSFVDANHGWAVGSSSGGRGEAATIIATSDGGATWTVQYTDPDARFSSLSGVSFVDRDHGWAVGSRYLEGADGPQSAILATSDGGRTWTPQQSGTSATILNDVKFVDANHGWAVGGSGDFFEGKGAILATSDGGATWTPQESGTSASLNGVDFVDSLHGTAVGGSAFGEGGVIVTTSDGGETWTPRNSGTSAGLNDVDLVTATRGYAVGGGFVNNGGGFGTIEPSGVVVATSDAGETWSAEASNTRETLNGVSFPDPGQPNVGYAAGESGTIQKRATAPPRPTVTAVEPSSGSTIGPTSVTIRGTGFTGAVAVNFGAVSLPSYRYTVVSDTEITVETPTEQSAGTVHVTVTGPRRTSGARPEDTSAETAADQFTYVAPTGGEWRLTGSLSSARLRHSATQLKDGKVLVVGGRTPPPEEGFEPGRVLASAELYDPATGEWRSCSEANAGPGCPGPLATARAEHTATLLPNGKVLVTGGTDDNEDYRNRFLASAELYDPTTGKWSSAGSLAEPRQLHSATLLSGPRCGSRCGMVLVTGGTNGANGARSLASSQLYDPGNNRWLAADDLEQGRNGHTAHMLPDGRLLVASGYKGHAFEHSDPPDPEAQPELYDPQEDRWSFAERQEAPSHGNAGALLASGKVLVAGGLNMVGRDTGCLSDLYDPATNSWSSPGSFQVCRSNHGEAGSHTLTPLADGRAVMAGGDRCLGGCTTAAVELFDQEHPLGNSVWRLVASMNFARQAHTATLLSGPGCEPSCGKVLVAGGGGYNSDFSKFTAPAAAELYTPPGEGTGGGGPPPGGQPGGPSGGQPQDSARNPALAAFTGCPSPAANVIRGNAAADTITGTLGGDRIFAGTGSDTVDGLAGDDCIDLGAGNDRGQGGLGADLMLGGLGSDLMAGSTGNDRLRGGPSGDRINGGFGNDRLHGQSGSDAIFGSRGRDRINGGSSNDVVSAGSSNDRVAGDQGSDRINGNSGNDVLKGNSGNDRIRGSTGADRIAGGSGKDRINSRDGRRDRVNCGRGRDRVVADRFDRVARNCERVRRR